MGEMVTDILFFGIYSAYQDTGRDKVCRIFIPDDSRMFDKFCKTLKRNIADCGEGLAGVLQPGSGAFLEEPWFYRYLQNQASVPDAYHYVLENEGIEDNDECFLQELVDRAKGYAADCGDKDLGTGEAIALKEFYRMVIKVVRLTIAEITPKAEPRKVDLRGTQKEIRAQVLHNLEHGKMENEEMWWHIRYCIDHGICQYTDLMSRVAKHGCWKAWVRQAAAEYCCRFMGVGEVCEYLLPGLSGKLLYWTIAQFAATKDERLKERLREHAEYYTGQEMLKDISLVKMQDRGGTGRIRRYLERTKHVPGRMENPDPVLAFGGIREIGLLDELGKLIDLLMRENFRDRACNGLQVALVAAMSTIAASGREEYSQVMQLLDEKLAYYREYGWEKGKGAGGRAEEKLAALICLNEDIRWRTRYLPNGISAIDISS